MAPSATRRRDPKLSRALPPGLKPHHFPTWFAPVNHLLGKSPGNGSDAPVYETVAATPAVSASAPTRVQGPPRRGQPGQATFAGGQRRTAGAIGPVRITSSLGIEMLSLTWIPPLVLLGVLILPFLDGVSNMLSKGN